MKRAYILLFNDRFGKQETIGQFLNSIPEITHWRYDTPAHCIFIVSASDAKHLATRIRSFNPDDGAVVFVTPIVAESFGWLSKPTWYLVKNFEYDPATLRS